MVNVQVWQRNLIETNLLLLGVIKKRPVAVGVVIFCHSEMFTH